MRGAEVTGDRVSRFRCPKCGQFYSDNGLPLDYERRQEYSLAMHCDVSGCPAMPYWEADSESLALTAYEKRHRAENEARWREIDARKA